jgi:hypothetical protein
MQKARSKFEFIQARSAHVHPLLPNSEHDTYDQDDKTDDHDRLLNDDPNGMPTGNSVEVRKDQHGDQHESVGGNADRIDLGNVEPFLSLGVENGFLESTKGIQVSRQGRPGTSSERNTHKEEDEPAVRVLAETPESVAERKRSRFSIPLQICAS